MSVLALLFVAHQAAVPFEFDVRAGQGLTVSAKGIPIIRGSGFQYYAPGWAKGYYSSHWKGQTVRRVDADTIDVTFSEGPVSGSTSYRRAGNKLTVDYTFNWNSDEPAQIELNDGLLWAPPFQNGSVTLDGATRDLPQLPPVGGLDKRLLGKAALQTTMKGPVASVSLTASEPISTFDGRRYDQDWAEDAPVYWQGILDLAITKGTPKKVHLEYTFDAKDQVKGAPRVVMAPAKTIPDAELPDESIPPLIPDPKMSLLDYGNTLAVTNNWKLPAGRPKFFDLLKSEFDKRFSFPAIDANTPAVSFDGGMSDFKKPEGTYHIKITNSSVSVYGQEAMGLRNGIYRLAQLAFIKDGKVCLPTGIIQDEPRTEFRGVHLFVGPSALSFHQKLWSNVLRPLGFNKVVLQCERTDWKALPGIHTNISMSEDDLVKLFKWYRSQEVEPIPLIQSFGHMEWLFANGKNLNLAVNPKNPYAIDPRKPEARELVSKLWDEAITTLKPKTVHFGLDEVDMIGFDKPDPDLVTDMWKQLMPTLGDIAKRNNVKPMLWGDEGLAPAEAVDAMNGSDLANARERRDAIPKGAFIADWHYKPDPSHVPFVKSLQLWKNANLNPIASMWYRPENIRGFSLAADVEDVGTLQTTWNGYESSEANMLRDLKQYSAMVLAADYSWSARSENVSELPYDPMTVFAKMYNPHPSPLVAAAGATVGDGALFTCGNVRFATLDKMTLSGISTATVDSPDSLIVNVTGTAKEVALALTCDFVSPDAEKIGEATITYSDGTQDKTDLLYGLHVRARDDDGGTFYGLREKDVTCLRLPAKAKPIRNVSVATANRYSGIQLVGLTLLRR